MAERSVISGRVVDDATGAGIAGLRVEALDAAGLFRDLLGHARTDADGDFRMEVLTADLAALMGQRAVVACLRVVHEPSAGVYNVLADMRTSGPRWPLDGRVTSAVLQVSTARILSRLPSLLPFVVSGTVRDENGPMEAITVKLFDHHPVNGVPTEPMEGATGTTDARGRYRITYSPPIGKDRADLVVRAEAAVTTDVGPRCHAPPALVVDVVQEGHRWRGVSTYSSTRAKLANAGVNFEDPGAVTVEQREHLACSLRLPLADVGMVLDAAVIANASSPLEAEVAFAALSRGMGTDRDSFFRHPKAAVRDALIEAADANRIPQRYSRQSELDAALGRWVQSAAAWSLETRADPCGLGELLVVAGVAEAPDRTSFAEQLCDNEAAMPDFWDGLAGSFDKPRLQLALQWWSLTRGHLPLIEKLEVRRAAETDETLEDLARLSEEDWLDILDTLSTGAPPGIPGADATERKANYARVLCRTMATAFPTRAFAARVSTQEASHPGIQSFFATHTTFELGRDRLSQEPFHSAVKAMSAGEQKRILAMERLFRFAPAYERTSALLERGYDSAHSVHSAGRGRFVAAMEPTLGTAVAAELFTKACWQTGASSALLAQLGQGTNQLPGKALANIGALSPQLSADIPDWQTLFGSAGGCSCKHCAGVLGPAAYLTDSLMWLDGFDSEVPRATNVKWTALDILVGSDETGDDPPPGRRPDLPLLELTCKSAHTPQPYIDLVNELLEVAVAKDAGVTIDTVSPIKSTFEPDELAAGPEILYEVAHIGAWRSLMERRHPFTLPACLFDDESEAYLRYLGVTRAGLVKALGGTGDELAKARLGVRDDSHDAPDDTLLSGWKMLLGTDSGTAQEHWGGQSAASLKPVSMFMKYSGLQLDELEELLATRYVNGDDGNGAPGLAALLLSPPDGCDVSAMTLPALTSDHLDRIHPFLRLRHHTGLSSTDLDLLLAAFWTPADPPQPIGITAGILQDITGALALAGELTLSVREVAGLFADLDLHERWEDKSPYRHYFLNRLVESPEPAVFANVLTNPGATADLSLHKAALQQVLGLGEKELLLLVDAATLDSELSLPEGQLVVGDFTADAAILPRVSELWRHVRFARALGLRVADYLVLRAHSGLTPIGAGATPATAEQFVDLVRAFQALRLTAAELQWVLRAFSTPGAVLPPHTADIEALRVEITTAIDALVSETEVAEDAVDGESAAGDEQTRVHALLAELLTDEEEREDILEVLRGSDDPPDLGAWRDRLDPIAMALPAGAGAPGGAKDLLAGSLNTPSNPDEQLPPLLVSPSERFAYAARWLERHIRGSRLVVERVAAAAGLPVVTTRHLLATVLASQSDSQYTVLDDFLPANRTGASEAHQAAGLGLVLRHARLISALRVREPVPPAPGETELTGDMGELLWVYPVSPPTGGLHALPPAPATFGAGDQARFARILAVAQRTSLRDRMAGGEDALRQLLESAPGTLAEAQELLAEKSGWDLTAITALCAPLGLADAEALLSDSGLARMEKAVALVRRLGLAPEEVLAFADLETPPPAAVVGGLQPTTDPQDRNARDLVLLARRAAKAKLSTEEWSRVARKIRDPFREQLRDRLVDALVPKLHATRDDLYGFHLIDVDMGACLMTSRIVQATNAVQIFVQRSFLGLDPEVKLPAQAGRQWEHRRAYRLWEANRKVFLWPENWLEPELRDDMTPLFRDFLTNLSSGELTDASAERALEKYLTGLHEIARLDPMALWYDAETQTDHVVARTRSQPRRWFYRRRERNMTWTPWEKMDVDIEAESALLVGHQRRLYLFWPQLILKSSGPAAAPAQQDTPPGPQPTLEKGESPAAFVLRVQEWVKASLKWENGGQTAVEPAQHHEVRIAWSSLVDGAWTAKRLSDCEPIKVSPARGESDTGYEPRHVSLVLEPQSGPAPADHLRILCVATPWFVLMNTVRVGRFTFDACAGGRWTSTQLQLPGQTPAVYKPAAPGGSGLSRSGFLQLNAAGLVRVHHAPGGQGESKPVKLLGDHDGQFFIVSPSSYKKSPTHAFDRFLFADNTTVFHGRALQPAPAWKSGVDLKPGEVAGMFPAWDGLAGAVSGAVGGWSQSQDLQVPVPSSAKYELEVFEHPFVCELADRLAAGGPAGLLGWKEDPEASPQYLHTEIEDVYDPTANVLAPFPEHEISFEYGSAYGMYNWELFFHVPFTIAQRLSQEGRYAEAQRWFHFIFNPVSGVDAPGPRRFWCVKPFHEIPDLATVAEGLTALAAASSFAASLQALVAEDEATQKAADEMRKQVTAMTEHPFAPHVLARMRPLAYMKNVFMRYLQNLIDWGDSLFRRDTMESIHEALTLYLLAADLLGPRPQLIEHKAEPAGKTFEQLLAAGIDELGNAAVDVEKLVPKQVPLGFACTDDGPPVPDFRLYFCIPPNEQLAGYWDAVSDRLFKIRNCMNIEGVVRALPLFAPPIDPALLVRAAAAGVRLDQVLDALAAPAPLYRFVRLHAKAQELAGAVQSLGQGLLAALEKKDGEELSLLRQRHELAVLDAEREVRREAIREATETLAGLNRSRQIAETRLQHYTSLLDKGLIQQEKDATLNTTLAKVLRKEAAIVNELDVWLAAIPDVTASAGPPSATIGGRALQLATGAVSRKLSSEADGLNTDASLAQTAAGYMRRAQEWRLQKSLGEKELAQIDRQIAAQEIRLAMAERELENLDLRREQSREIDAFFRGKFTSRELYTWMAAQIAAEHYRAYQTAYDMAKKAERAYQLERGDDRTFVRFGAWDSLKKGLLAGERLLGDLRALDAAYLSRSDREREITKHVSLAEIAGEELTKLRDEGSAELELHPHHFDADYPGHYFRRIKTVAISVATVRPASDGVQCELTLLQSAYRRTSQVSDAAPYPGDPYGDDASYRYTTAAQKSLVTSSAENDPGLFEVSLRDEMLLPFEGAGVISQWRIEVDPKTNRFPMHRISDVVLHLRYTAKDGGPALRSEALAAAEGTGGLKQRTRVFSARRDFDEAWAVFTAGTMIDDAPETWANRLELRFTQSHFRSFFGKEKVKIVRIQVSATFNTRHLPATPTGDVDYTLARPAGSGTERFAGALDFRAGEPSVSHTQDPDSPSNPFSVPVKREDDETLAPWVFEVEGSSDTPADIRLGEADHYLLKPDAFEDIWFTVTYEAQ